MPPACDAIVQRAVGAGFRAEIPVAGTSPPDVRSTLRAHIAAWARARRADLRALRTEAVGYVVSGMLADAAAERAAYLPLAYAARLWNCALLLLLAQGLAENVPAQPGDADQGLNNSAFARACATALRIDAASADEFGAHCTAVARGLAELHASAGVSGALQSAYAELLGV